MFQQFKSTFRQIFSRQFTWYVNVWKSKSDYPSSLFEKIKWNFRGFTVNEANWYNFKENDYHGYISDYERLLSRKVNGPYHVVLDNTLLFAEVFGKYIRVPKNYAIVTEGVIKSFNDSLSISYDNLLSFVDKYSNLIIKPLGGGGGNGVHLIAYNESQLYLDGEKTDLETIVKLIKGQKRSIISEYIHQSSFSASLYPHTTNTIRVVCAKFKGENSARILGAVQRIGRETTIPCDNICQGGLACKVDIETGRIGYGIARSGKLEDRLKKFSHHPDSKGQIEGKVIPNWEIIKKDLLEATDKFPFIQFIAWDVLLTEEGYCVIEGNASCGNTMFQMEHGCRDSIIGDYYRSYGII